MRFDGAHRSILLPQSLARRNIARPTARVRVGGKVGVPPALVAHVRVQLGRREVGMPEHLLDAAEIGATLQQMRGKRVSEEVGVNSFRFQTGAFGEAAQDHERSRAGQPSALGVQEELLPVAAVEVRATASEIPAYRLCGGTAERNDALFAPFAETTDEALIQVDAGLLETDRFADT